MALMLLYERLQGPKSKLCQYLEQLPKSYDSPVLWEPKLVKELQYPYLIQKAGVPVRSRTESAPVFCF